MPTVPDWAPSSASIEPEQEMTPADYLSAVSDEDNDAVIAPAPAADVLAHVPSAGSAVLLSRRTRLPSMAVQRTLIPILLTCGILLMLTGALHWLSGDASPFAALPDSMSIGMLAGGALIFLIAVANMLHVRAVRLRHAAGGAELSI
jgi:hypothetical protein